jgi:hypothetical protein
MLPEEVIVDVRYTTAFGGLRTSASDYAVYVMAKCREQAHFSVGNWAMLQGPTAAVALMTLAFPALAESSGTANPSFGLVTLIESRSRSQAVRNPGAAAARKARDPK